MAVHGKNAKIYVNGYDLTTYFSSFDVPVSVDMADISTFGISSKKAIPGLKSATIQADGFFDSASNAVVPVLEAAIGSEQSRWCYFPDGDTRGNQGKAIEGVETQYQVKSTIDDATKIMATAQSNVGAEPIVSLMALSTVTATGSTTAVDNTAATTNGGSVYIHATAATGTVVVVVEHSTNNSTWTTLASFTNVSGRTSERVAISGTINRYVRATYTLDGGESLTAQISLSRG